MKEWRKLLEVGARLRFEPHDIAVRLRPDEAREVRDAIRESADTQPNWLRGAILKAARQSATSPRK